MKYHHITGYEFIELTDLDSLKECMLDEANQLQLRGTILLSHEGININLAGRPENIEKFILFVVTKRFLFSNMKFKKTMSDVPPYKRLKVKIKPEIITFKRGSEEGQSFKYISPTEFKQWLDHKDEVIVIDTRNDFEVEYGTFDTAINLHIKQFTDFPFAVNSFSKNDKQKRVVIFCTGGVRCEKAAPAMKKLGFQDVYQLEGGIINYFAECGRAHYHGECFVFDDRVTITEQACYAK